MKTVNLPHIIMLLVGFPITIDSYKRTHPIWKHRSGQEPGSAIIVWLKRGDQSIIMRTNIDRRLGARSRSSSVRGVANHQLPHSLDFALFPSDSYPPCTCLRGMRAIQCRSVSAVSAAKPVAKLVKRQRGLLSGQCRPGVLVADTQTHNSAESYSLLVVVSRFCHSNGPHEWMANGRSICRGNRQSNVRISSSGWNVVIWLECMGIMDRHFEFQFIIDGWFWAFRPSRHLTDHQTFSLRCGKWMKRRSNKYLNIIQDLQ